MANSLSREAQEKIDKMVERVARKAGYTDRANMTYKEHIQTEFERQRDRLVRERDRFKRELNKYRHKFSMKPSNTDFAEEIRTYLQDGLLDLMNEGYSEEEAIKITLEKFDEAELNDSFDDFVKAFEGFGMEDYQEMTDWYAKNGEAIGLFYAAFVMIGAGLGVLFGYLFGHTLLNTLIGLGIGFCLGAGCGLFSHAIITLKRGR